MTLEDRFKELRPVQTLNWPTSRNDPVNAFPDRSNLNKEAEHQGSLTPTEPERLELAKESSSKVERGRRNSATYRNSTPSEIPSRAMDEILEESLQKTPLKEQGSAVETQVRRRVGSESSDLKARSLCRSVREAEEDGFEEMRSRTR